MGDFTTSGIRRFAPSDRVKNLEDNLNAISDTVQDAFDAEVGVRKVVPASSSGGNTDLLGSFVVKDATEVKLDSLFDSDRYLGWEVDYAFNLVQADASFFARIRAQGDYYGGPGSYGWEQARRRHGEWAYREAYTDNGDGRPWTDNGSDRFPLSWAPGSDHEHTAFGTIKIMRAGDRASASGFVTGGTNMLYGVPGDPASAITRNETTFAYRATGRDFDGIGFFLSNHLPFSGVINVYARN